MIDLQAALAAADSRGDLEWRINFGGGVKAAKKEDVALEMPSESLDGDLNPMAAKAALAEAEVPDARSEADKSLDDALGDLKPLDEVKLIEDE
jgi:twitching motility protein PilU